MADVLLVAGVEDRVSFGGNICTVPYLEGTSLHRDRCFSQTERASKLMPCVAQSAGERLMLDLKGKGMLGHFSAKGEFTSLPGEGPKFSDAHYIGF